MEALRGVAVLPGPRIGTQSTAASGLALKIEDGDGYDRGTWAASVEALRQIGAWTVARCATWPGTTGRSPWIRTAVPPPRQSPTSSWYRWAS